MGAANNKRNFTDSQTFVLLDLVLVGLRYNNGQLEQKKGCFLFLEKKGSQGAEVPNNSFRGV